MLSRQVESLLLAKVEELLTRRGVQSKRDAFQAASPSDDEGAWPELGHEEGSIHLGLFAFLSDERQWKSLQTAMEYPVTS
jgi:hypothetical protein